MCEQVAQIDWTSGAMLSATKIVYPSLNGTFCCTSQLCPLTEPIALRAA